ncbi:integrase [Polynucleobacter sp. Tro8-14-1]|uniref:phage exclusion protein Lit family protein n=1 Tax=Polynucleobacter sp. AP-Nickl1-40-C4 TaxID=3108275 RepID=UPI001C0B2576|nr:MULTISPECIES: phage exclusion protein Lit family protein [unclassified Polynucleobacter]MBU3563840.1 integrase [Polynucleobacter sp. Tro8-14-1]MEA9569073.1 phage exclusion protein Lit family protein [Polynucleobacter sp. AP-Nickl1-40-C4]
MRSPICLLEFQIAGALFNVAPEKEIQCIQHRDDYQFDLVFVDEKKFGIRVRFNEDDAHPEIVLPISSLEYLWAFSHYCWVLTQEYAASQRGGSENFNCLGNERLKTSSKLLQWARRNLFDSGIERWPELGPRPMQDACCFDDSQVATELFLVALGWIMHHEIAHVVLRHPLIRTSFLEQEEREADQFATEWLLDGLKKNDSRFRKRALGVATAVLAIQSLEVDSTACLRNTHPDAHDRIFQNIELCGYAGDETIEAFCVVVLQYLFCQTTIKVNVDGNSFSEILSDLLFDISRAKNAPN